MKNATIILFSLCLLSIGCFHLLNKTGERIEQKESKSMQTADRVIQAYFDGPVDFDRLNKMDSVEVNKLVKLAGF